MDKSARLKEFLYRLERLAPARSVHEAYGQIYFLLNEVEDELSGVPYNLSQSTTDGRMYPPQWDFMRPAPGRTGTFELRSARHRTFISDTGEIEILFIPTGQQIFRKPGAAQGSGGQP